MIVCKSKVINNRMCNGVCNIVVLHDKNYMYDMVIVLIME